MCIKMIFIRNQQGEYEFLNFRWYKILIQSYFIVLYLFIMNRMALNNTSQFSISLIARYELLVPLKILA